MRFVGSPVSPELLGSGQMSPQERKGAGVAVEAVARVFVPVNLDFGMGIADLVHLLGGDVGVEFAEVELNGSCRGFLGEVADAAGVVAHRCIGLEPRCTQPGEKAAEAVADD